MTREAPPDGVTVATYTFTAASPGTYMYNSGTRPELQIEMGLVGALIIRPDTYVARPEGEIVGGNQIAYNHVDSAYDHEYLFLHTEMDPRFHRAVACGNIDSIDNTTYNPVYWFLNGRCFPDTVLAAPSSALLPHQPYNCFPRMHPGQRVLMRMIGGGRDAHPFHPHSNNIYLIARDGRLFPLNEGGDVFGMSEYTPNILPGATHDAIFEWTGKGLGWDIYGHAPGDGEGLQPYEDPDDHLKPFPVILPEQKDLTFGLLYSGSPFLGSFAPLPPGGGLNLTGGFWQIWHSHHEKEVTNNDIFPGGQITFMLIDHWDVPIP
jgi:FtsP/CotA-like multicopper oxidase with cupredoxin domain